MILKEADDDDIIQVSPSKSSYVDGHYFETQMGEQLNNPSFTTFAVEVKSLRADWIINEDIGITFMNEMLKKKNREVFMTPYMQVVIQFMYEAYRHRIVYNLLPIYAVHLLFVNLYIFFVENMRFKVLNCILYETAKCTDEDKMEITAAVSYSNAFIIICAIMTLVNVFVFYQQTMILKF